MLIRHGETAGNQKQRYIGRRTDEPLLPQSQEVLKQLDYGEPQAVYASQITRHGSIPADFFHSREGRAGKNLSEETSPDFRWQLAAASAKIFPAPHWWYMAAPL